jgi:hypothetical protein
MLSLHINDDIVQVWVDRNEIYFEKNGGDPTEFKDFDSMSRWLAFYTQSIDTMAYLQRLESDVWKGNITIDIFPTIDQNCNTITQIGEAVIKHQDYEVATFINIDSFNLLCGPDKVFTKLTLWSED